MSEGPVTAQERRAHWDDRYRRIGPTAVSWYQDRPAVALDLLAEAGVPSSAAIVDVGGGAGRLVDALTGSGWTDVTVLDVSGAALQLARDRVGEQAAVTWQETDVLCWQPRRRYDVWHDRAVFHFLVSAEQRAAYRAALGRALQPGALVIVGTFAADGPTECSGLPVVRYDAAGLAAALGGSLRPVATRREEHVTPSGGVQPFTWVALRG